MKIRALLFDSVLFVLAERLMEMAFIGGIEHIGSSGRRIQRLAERRLIGWIVPPLIDLSTAETLPGFHCAKRWMSLPPVLTKDSA